VAIQGKKMLRRRLFKRGTPASICRKWKVLSGPRAIRLEQQDYVDIASCACFDSGYLWGSQALKALGCELEVAYVH